MLRVVVGVQRRAALLPRLPVRGGLTTTRRELIELGVPADRITVVHNGVDEPPPQRAGRSDTPSLVVLSRLVPHKQVEHALEVLARLVATWPALTLTVVGDGYWAEQVRMRADQLKVADRVRLVGHVDDATKHRVLASAWVHLSASIKEGWGLAIMEAARHGVPTVAYATAGGTADSVLADRTGLLVHDLDGMTRATAGLLSDPVRRRQLGDAARERAAAFTWNGTVTAFSELVDEVLGRPAASEPLAGAEASRKRRPSRGGAVISGCRTAPAAGLPEPCWTASAWRSGRRPARPHRRRQDPGRTPGRSRPEYSSMLLPPGAPDALVPRNLTSQ